jgi:hypothetical protein
LFGCGGVSIKEDQGVSDQGFGGKFPFHLISPIEGKGKAVILPFASLEGRLSAQDERINKNPFVPPLQKGGEKQMGDTSGAPAQSIRQKASPSGLSFLVLFIQFESLMQGAYRIFDLGFFDNAGNTYF